MSTKFYQIAEQARSNPDKVFTNLAHFITKGMLNEAFTLTRKGGALGIDNCTSDEYAEKLQENIEDLHDRLKNGRYRAPNIKRVWIPKEGSRKKRPIGITTFEDKLVQRAVHMVLTQIYEQDFYDFSYGFREGKSAHEALQQIRTNFLNKRIKWVIDADIVGCFDNLDHQILHELLEKRVKDGSIKRLIGKWLKAGVVDGKSMSYTDKGSPQGGVISPMIANIYLHYVIDKWMVEDIAPRMSGAIEIARFADDFIIGFESKEDAERVYKVLPKRLEKYKLTIHPEKTHLVRFKEGNRKGMNSRTFTFLGFTHYWGKTRYGGWTIKRRTKRVKISNTIKKIDQWCRKVRHIPLADQHRILSQKLGGHYQYFAIRCNFKQLLRVFNSAVHSWFKWLNRRGQKKSYCWDSFSLLLRGFPLPFPKIIHKEV